MKLNALFIQNYIGARDVDITITAPVLMVTAGHGNGKSSLKEAIRHAVTEESTRVSLKKDYGQLLTDGTKKGNVVVSWEGGQASVAIPSGKHMIEYEGVTTDVAEIMKLSLPYVMEPNKFAKVSADERRAFLYKLTRVKTGAAVLGEMLEKRGCDMVKAKELIPLVRSGFASMAAEAAARMTTCRADWKATTGEVHGVLKAESWVAETPVTEDNTAALAAEKKKLAKCTADLEAATLAVGALTERVTTAQRANARIVKLKADAAALAESKAALAESEKKLADAEAAVVTTQNALDAIKSEIETAEALAIGDAVGKPIACPCCATMVEITGDGLIEYVPPTKVANADALARLPGLRKTLATLSTTASGTQKTISQAKHDVSTNMQAIATAEAAGVALKDEVAATAAPTPQEITVAQAALDDIKTLRQASVEAIAKFEQDGRVAAEGDAKTLKAAGLHLDYKAWEKIAKALAPDGIQTDLLVKAIEPFNAALARSAGIAQWEQVMLDGQMEVHYGPRPYSARSESEQWRADAMIAETIANLSGIRLICFDRFDVLLSAERNDLVEWLIVATSESIDSAIIIAAMDKPPRSMPPEIQVMWLRDGVGSLIAQSIESNVA